MKTILLLLLCSLSLLSASEVEFSVFVDGQEVPVIEHRVRGHLNCAYAHFTLSEAVPVEVRVSSELQDWKLSPTSYQIPAKAEGDRILFTLPAPRYLVLKVNGTRLLLLADPPEPALPGGTVLDVTSAPYSADASGESDATKALQAALDAAGEIAGGATVYFPPGRYTTTGVWVRSHTQVFFAKGAILQGSSRAEDYREYPEKPGRTGISALLHVENVEEVHLLGYGTLDARGFALAGEAETINEVRLKARCLTVESSKKVTIEGLLCRESTSWSVPFFRSSDVVARRIKVINDIGALKHSDGINLCGVQNGLVEDCFVHTTDDAYCAKGHRGMASENLVFRRLVALSATRGVKCGMQAYEPMSKVLFEDVDVVQTRDGIDLLHQDGEGAWSEIVFREVRVEECSGNSFMASIRDGGSIRGVRFERIQFDEVRPGYLRGKDETSTIEDLTFSEVRMGGKLIKDLKTPGIKKNSFVRGVRFSP